jgi:phosphohistidine phosphatase
MRIYLARHGDAVGPEENPRRPLSAKGRAEVERMASFLARSGVRPRRVIHSGKLRAGETAAILARALVPGTVLEESEGLGPEDSPERLVSAARNWVQAALDGKGRGGESRRVSKDEPGPANDVLVVGHMPFMALALAALVGADATLEFAGFATGSVACLESEDDQGDRWRLLWLVSPGLLGG